jgi:transposase
MTRREGMGACIAAVEGATTKAVFEAYDVEEALAPSLGPGQEVVVMDNLSSHKGQRVRELIEGRGWELLYLAPYSPDLTTPSSGPWQSLRPRWAGRRPGPLGR